jgi:hypothetical protein
MVIFSLPSLQPSCARSQATREADVSALLSPRRDWISRIPAARPASLPLRDWPPSGPPRKTRAESYSTKAPADRLALCPVAHRGLVQWERFALVGNDCNVSGPHSQWPLYGGLPGRSAKAFLSRRIGRPWRKQPASHARQQTIQRVLLDCHMRLHRRQHGLAHKITDSPAVSGLPITTLAPGSS